MTGLRRRRTGWGGRPDARPGVGVGRVDHDRKTGGSGTRPYERQDGRARGGGDFAVTGCMGGLWGMASGGFQAGGQWLAEASDAAFAGVRLLAGGGLCGDDLYSRWRVSVRPSERRDDGVERSRSSGRSRVGWAAGVLPAGHSECVCGDAGSRAWGDRFQGSALAGGVGVGGRPGARRRVGWVSTGRRAGRGRRPRARRRVGWVSTGRRAGRGRRPRARRRVGWVSTGRRAGRGRRPRARRRVGWVSTGRRAGQRRRPYEEAGISAAWVVGGGAGV